MKCKYSHISNQQKMDYAKALHRDIHWLLIYKENGYDKLDVYFSSILFKLGGLNSLLHHPQEMIEVLSLLEAARMECDKSDCDFRAYRKAILDAQSLIDTIFNIDKEG